MEIERGGAMTSLTPTSSARPSGAATSAPPGGSGRPRADVSGLDVAYRRLDARPVEVGPSLGERIAGWTIPLVLLVGTIALLVKVAHQPGGRSVLRLLPHAFDASSTIQSGAAAIGALIGAIAIGFIGVKATPRSYAMIGSAAALLVASLAMVTVTLVSTDEEPIPPDGALLIPYVVPLAIFLLGLGVAGRGPSLFFGGGARRLGAALAGSLGGALVFAAIELSAIAARLP